MDLNILLLNIGRGALRPPEGRWDLVSCIKGLWPHFLSKKQNRSWEWAFSPFFGNELSRETDAFGIGFDVISAPFEMDVQAWRTGSRLISQKRIDGNQLACKSEKLLSQNLSIKKTPCERAWHLWFEVQDFFIESQFGKVMSAFNCNLFDFSFFWNFKLH